jgi:hypothetical protein
VPIPADKVHIGTDVLLSRGVKDGRVADGVEVTVGVDERKN